MNALQTILFDLDGTLTDPKEGITSCIRYAMNMLGYNAPDADYLTWCIGPPLKGSFSTLLKTSDECILGQALTHYRNRFSDIGMYENKLYPDAPKALEMIRNSGLKIMLATSKPQVYAAKILNFMGVMKYFHAVYGSSLDGHLTDKTHLVEYIVSKEKLNTHNTMIAGDREHDIKGGKANGIITAAVTFGYGSIPEIEKACPDYTFHSLLELASFCVSCVQK